jgi:hypothetical protein
MKTCTTCIYDLFPCAEYSTTRDCSMYEPAMNICHDCQHCGVDISDGSYSNKCDITAEIDPEYTNCPVNSFVELPFLA